MAAILKKKLSRFKVKIPKNKNRPVLTILTPISFYKRDQRQILQLRKYFHCEPK